MYTNKITIAIPVYERYEYFEEALNSAINQNVKCKIIVVDNASNTSAFEQYIEKTGNGNIKYFRNEINLGMAGNWNECIKLTTTEWVTILHDDDILFPNFIKEFLIVLDYLENQNPLCIASECFQGEYLSQFKKNHIDKKNLKVRRFNTNEFLYNNLSNTGITFKRDPTNFLFLDEFYPIQDFDFWVRLSKNGSIFKFSSVQAFYRFSINQTSMVVYEQIVRNSYLYRRNNIGYKNLISKFLSITHTFNQIRIYTKKYNKKIDINSILHIKDSRIAKVLSIKPIFFFSLLLGYSCYYFNYYCKYKKISNKKIY